VSANLANSSAPGAGAAPERFLRRIVSAPVAGGEREEILLEALRVLRTEPAVEKGALVRIHPARIGGPAEDVALKLHQVVGHAALRVRPSQRSFKLSGGRFPVFILARVADDVVAGIENFGKEVLGNFAIAAIARDFVHAGRANDLGNVRVGVQTLQLIAARGQRIKEARLLKRRARRRCSDPFS
jgi:hypothetical protein